MNRIIKIIIGIRLAHGILVTSVFIIVENCPGDFTYGILWCQSLDDSKLVLRVVGIPTYFDAVFLHGSWIFTFQGYLKVADYAHSGRQVRWSYLGVGYVKAFVHGFHDVRGY